MLIRAARADDWGSIWPFFRQIVTAGETYAYDPQMSETEAERVWMVGPPGRTVVAVAGSGRVVSSGSRRPPRWHVRPDGRWNRRGRADGGVAAQLVSAEASRTERTAVPIEARLLEHNHSLSLRRIDSLSSDYGRPPARSRSRRSAALRTE